MRKAFISMVGLLAVLGCGGTTPVSTTGSGGNGTDAGGGSGPTLTIQSFGYSPMNINVAPGSTITVQNLDSTPHSVTSRSQTNTFTPGAVNGVSFDTGAFTGTKTITIPSTAPHGTVIPYYCTVHLGMMVNNGQITVQ